MVQKNFFLIFVLFFFYVYLLFPVDSGKGSSISPVNKDGLFFSHINNSDGLSDLSVTSIVQDYRGFLWFSTLNGLNKFNGKAIVIYEHDPYNRETIPHNKIQTMVSYKNYLFLGTYSGLGIFDVDTGKSRNFENIPGDTNSLSDNVVVSILPDPDGKIWVGTLNGLNLLDPETGKCERFFHDDNIPASLSNNTVRALYMDSKKRVWIGTYNGLDLYDTVSKKFQHYGISGSKDTLFPSKYVMSIIDGGDDTLLLGTWGGGILRFFIKEGKFTTYSLEDNRVYSLKKMTDGSIWAGTWGGGLFIIDLESGKRERYKNESGNIQSISNNIVYTIFQDESGLVWIGTNGGGVNKTNPEKKNKTILYHDPENPESLTLGDVYFIFEDRKNNIWIGTSGGGLDRWDVKGNTLEHYKEADGKGLPNDSVTCVTYDSNGDLLFGTLKGVVRYVFGENRFLPLEIENGFYEERIYSLFNDSEGNLWVGTYDNGLYVYTSGTKSVIHYVNSSENTDSLSSNMVTSITESMAAIWIGTGNGLNRYNSNGTFDHYFLNPDDKKSISSNSIRVLYVDSNEKLWIGTDGGGINKYIPESDSFIHYMKQEGMSDDRVAGILEDNSGLLWCATKRGISILNPESGDISIIDMDNGLPDLNLNYGVLKRTSGDLYFSSKAGITSFSGTPENRNNYPLPLYITEVSSVGKVLETGIVKSGSSFVLPYLQNAFTLKFIGLDYENSKENKYMCILEGYDSDWVSLGNKTTVRYSGLVPGKYVFHVKAANSNGLWTDSDASVEISILRAPWDTKFAHFIYDIVLLLVVVAVFALFHHLRLRKELEKLKTLKEDLTSVNAMLKEDSVRDPLTGLHNRRELDFRLGMEISRARRFKTPISIFMIDIDYFKDYNDRYGHLEGDICLKKIADSFVECLVRDSDFIARYGGEEFCIIIPGCHEDEAGVVSHTILRNIQKKRIVHKNTGIGGIVTVSIGVATGIPSREDTGEIIINLADKALYEAKRKGRNRIIKYSF